LQVLTIPLLPLAFHRAPSTFWRACLVGVASLWWMCFIGSGSRTGWIAIAAAGLMAALLGSEGRRWLRCQLVFGALGLLSWGLLFHALPALLSGDTAPETGRLSDFASVGYRLQLWRISIESALAHPMLGTGPMHFAYVENGLGAHPHNFWLQLAAEWGIPATLLFVSASVVLGVGMWQGLKGELDRASRAVGVALFAVVTAWGIGTLSDGYMVVPTSQAMSTVVLMLAVMWLRSVAPASPTLVERRASAHGRSRSYAMAALGVIALAVLATLPFTEFGQPTRREQVWRGARSGQTMWPRFWQQGWIGPHSDPTARQAKGAK
jgi:putative inorganic carbon (hco3(-)) transporter